MLFWKFEMGLFDDPYVDPDEAERVVGCDEHRELALQAARETITLLKNENDLAPLDPRKHQDHRGDRTQRESQLCWAATAACPSTMSRCWTASRAKVGDRVKVLYSEGCKITIGGSWNQDEVVASDPEEDRKQIAEAVKVAQQGRCHRAGDRRQRADLARGMGAQAHGRPRQPRSDRPAGGTGEGDAALPASR